MSNSIFEKARELGRMIIESEQSIRLADAASASSDDNDNNTELELAEKDLKTLLNQVIGIINETVTGDADGGEAKSVCEKCGGCSKR